MSTGEAEFPSGDDDSILMVYWRAGVLVGVCGVLSGTSPDEISINSAPQMLSCQLASRWQLKAASPAAICLRVQGPGVISVLRTRCPQARRRFSTSQPSPVYTAEDCGTR